VPHATPRAPRAAPAPPRRRRRAGRQDAGVEFSFEAGR
jgi:hypothetical protein